MTTTIARQARIRFADQTAPLAQVVINAKFATIVETEVDEFTTCPMCGHATAEVFTRIDNRDGAEIEICETCADTQDVSYCADFDA